MPFTAALLTLCVTWGLTYVVIKVGLRSSTPEAFATLRVLFGGIVLCGIALVSRRPFPRTWRVQRKLAILGVLNVGGFAGLLNVGLLSVSAGESSLLVYTQPLWIAVLAAVFLRERLTHRRLLGLALGFAGVLVVLGPQAQASHPGTWWAYGALILAALSWAVASIYYRSEPLPIDQYWMTGLQCFYGAVPIALAWWLLEAAAVPRVGWGLLWTVAFAGALSSGLAYLLWYWMLRRREATLVGIAVFLVPPFAVLFGGVFLGERPSLNLVAGTAMVLLGLAITRKS